MTARKLQPCGTDAARQRHYVAGEEPCEACKEATRAYQRNRSNGEAGAVDKARLRAKTMLALLYPDEFEALVKQELDRVDGGQR